jgi:hypothetical protein
MAFVNWSTHEWLHFLRGMPEGLMPSQMNALDDAFHFTNTGNSEIAAMWFILAIRTTYYQAYPAMERFLSTIGRRKFLEPLYTEMMRAPNGEEMAKRIYSRYKHNYHPLAQESLDEIVLKINH